MISNKMVIYFGIVLILTLLVGGLAYSMIESPINTTSLIVKDIGVTNEKLHIEGTTINSGLAFNRYKYAVVNESLYLTLNYSLVNSLRKSGDFNITIEDNLLNVNKVYLKGRDSDDLRLVWSN